MLISSADQKLLNDHQVQINIDSKEKCGLIKIQDRYFKVALLTRPSGANDTAWEAKELREEQMKETASKVAVMLLKKELIQAQSQTKQLSEFKIHNQGFTTNLPNKKTIAHEDSTDENKNTRPDYDALMDYLSSIIENEEEEEIEHDKIDESKEASEEEIENDDEDELDVQLGIDEKISDLSANHAQEPSKKEEILSSDSLVKKESQLQVIDSKGAKRVANTIPRSLFSSIYPSSFVSPLLKRGVFGWIPGFSHLFSNPVAPILPVAKKSSVKALTNQEETSRKPSDDKSEEVAKTAKKEKKSLEGMSQSIDSSSEGSFPFDWEEFWNNQRRNQKWDQQRQEELFERLKRRESFPTTPSFRGNFSPFSYWRKKQQPTVSQKPKPLQSEQSSLSPQIVESVVSPKRSKFPKPTYAPGNEDEIFYYNWKKLQAKRQASTPLTPPTIPSIKTPQTSSQKPSFFSSEGYTKKIVDMALNPFI